MSKQLFFSFAIMICASFMFVSCGQYNVFGQCETYARSEGWPTASGEPFNSSAYTAAHKTLPFGTKVIVRTGFTANIVTINDRPVVDDDKIIQLTAQASKRLIFEQGLPCSIDWSPNCCEVEQFGQRRVVLHN